MDLICQKEIQNLLSLPNFVVYTMYVKRAYTINKSELKGIILAKDHFENHFILVMISPVFSGRENYNIINYVSVYINQIFFK